MLFKPTQLSGGQKQRVAIARAIVNHPRLLLADEPTGALDTKSGDQVMELFKELNDEGVTIVMITHEPDIAKCAKRVMYIRDGQLHTGAFNTREAAAQTAPDAEQAQTPESAVPAEVMEPAEPAEDTGKPDAEIVEVSAEELVAVSDEELFAAKQDKLQQEEASEA